MSLRELVLMAEGRCRAAWDHTASILALVANCHRDPKRQRPLCPADFHPYRPRTERRAGVAILKDVFLRDRTKGS